MITNGVPNTPFPATSPTQSYAHSYPFPNPFLPDSLTTFLATSGPLRGPGHGGTQVHLLDPPAWVSWLSKQGSNAYSARPVTAWAWRFWSAMEANSYHSSGFRISAYAACLWTSVLAVKAEVGGTSWLLGTPSMQNPVGCPCMGAGPGAPPLAWPPTMPQPALHEAGSAAGSFLVPEEEEEQEGEGKVSVRSGGPAASRGPAGGTPNATGVASSGPPAPPAAGRPLGRLPLPPPAARDAGPGSVAARKDSGSRPPEQAAAAAQQQAVGKVSVRSGGPAASRGPAGGTPNATGVAAAASSGPPAPPAAGRPLGRLPSPPPAPRDAGPGSVAARKDSGSRPPEQAAAAAQQQQAVGKVSVRSGGPAASRGPAGGTPNATGVAAAASSGPPAPPAAGRPLGRLPSPPPAPRDAGPGSVAARKDSGSRPPEQAAAAAQQQAVGKVSVRSGGPAASRGPAGGTPNATGVAAAASSGPPAPPAAGRPLGRLPSPPPAPRGKAT
nr:collagen alpha-1(I) chain-like [Equus asinus]